MRGFVRSVSVFVVLLAVGLGLFNYWPYIFARTVTGVISDVQRVATPVAVVGSAAGGASARDLFSFAVGIREPSGEIVTASSEDRQWAVAKAGQCAEAKFYPYPPWEFDKAGTYFGARLLKLKACDTGSALPIQDAAVTPPSAPNVTIDAAVTAAAVAEGAAQAEAAAAAAAAGAQSAQGQKK
jgi:hypothetical protein